MSLSLYITYIAKCSGNNSIGGWNDIKANSNIEHNGTSSYQVVQVGTGKSNQPTEIKMSTDKCVTTDVVSLLS